MSNKRYPMGHPLVHSDEFNLMTEHTVNGPTGQITQWLVGADFDCLLTLNSSTEAIIAGRQDNISIFEGLVEKSVPLKNTSVFKRKSDGATFRLTSDPVDDVTPGVASFNLMFFTCERWNLPS